MSHLNSGEFIVGALHKTSGTLSFTQRPFRHNEIKIAMIEAQRLAQLDQSNEYVVVEIKGIVSVDKTVWR